MFQQLFSIRTSDPNLANRGRLLKVAALISLLAAVAFLPITSYGDASLISTFSMMVVALIIFAMAHYGYITLGGVLLIAAHMVTIVSSTPAEELAGHSPGMAFIIPILVAGLVLGATAVLITGVAAMAALITVILIDQVTWGAETWINILLLIISSGLVWLIIRLQERSAAFARRQAEEAHAAHKELQQREQALVAANEELKSSNAQLEALLGLVRELEIPVIPLLEGVLVVPLVGHLDTRRVDQINHRVLDAVYEQRARTVIIDITGISIIDTAVAQRIEQLAQSIQLLGARVMLTGIKADIAQTIIDLGLNFSTIRTAGRLQDGVAAVLGEMGRHN
ncbi:MAG: hypothetical protein KatS3mg057_2386 [Herpetosiphonaceae bacterium]|nr:MAG: hypothetical protein KatS3mg057_2386 [Herpetosiphonaceae bacterium]